MFTFRAAGFLRSHSQIEDDTTADLSLAALKRVSIARVSRTRNSAHQFRACSRRRERRYNIARGARFRRSTYEWLEIHGGAGGGGHLFHGLPRPARCTCGMASKAGALDNSMGRRLSSENCHGITVRAFGGGLRDKVTDGFANAPRITFDKVPSSHFRGRSSTAEHHLSQVGA